MLRCVPRAGPALRKLPPWKMTGRTTGVSTSAAATRGDTCTASPANSARSKRSSMTVGGRDPSLLRKLSRMKLRVLCSRRKLSACVWACCSCCTRCGSTWCSPGPSSWCTRPTALMKRRKLPCTGPASAASSAPEAPPAGPPQAPLKPASSTCLPPLAEPGGLRVPAGEESVSDSSRMLSTSAPSTPAAVAAMASARACAASSCSSVRTRPWKRTSPPALPRSASMSPRISGKGRSGRRCSSSSPPLPVSPCPGGLGFGVR
mmetsp:Transcript_21674/g.58356  ORF Transcript_21674/g.58356 Transcript_21674/m.58356 type:complete len:261 (-) Transcript_21674:63-845(-)